MRLVVVRRAGLLAALVVLFGAAVAVAAPTTEAKPKPTSPADKIRQDLDQLVTLDISEQPLNLAVNQLREQTKINFVLDKFTLAQLGIDPEQMPVTVKLKDVKLRTALRTIFGPYNLSYAILGDTVLISTDEVAMYRQMNQRINVDLDNVEFTAALKQLSRETGVNLVLDPRVVKEAQGKVTLQLDDAPLDKAVAILCEMVGLKRVRIGNALFICSKATATELRSDPDLFPPVQRNPDGTPIPVPVPGGIGLPGGMGGFVPGGFGPGGAVPPPNIQIVPLKESRVPLPVIIDREKATEVPLPKVENPAEPIPPKNR
jgi:hypothetical protein